MAGRAKTDTTEALKQLTYLASALKAPRITEAAARLADHARDAGWTHEEYLAAVLDREVAARNASGAQLRIRAAGFAARKTIEEFDWDPQPGVRQQIASLASGGFLTEARNVVLLGPPGTGKTHLATGLGIAAANHGHRVLFATAVDWVTRLTEAHRAGRLPHELARLRRYGLIIVDEVGYLPFEQDAANLFFQLVSSRYEHAFFCNSEKKLSMAALLPAAPTRPMDPTMLCWLRARTNFRLQNWLPLSVWTTQPATWPRRATALSSAATASRNFILESME